MPQYGCTRSPASSKPNSAFPRSSHTRATRAPPGADASECSASTPTTATRRYRPNTTSDQLDEDHPHIGSVRRAYIDECRSRDRPAACWKPAALVAAEPVEAKALSSRLASGMRCSWSAMCSTSSGSAAASAGGTMRSCIANRPSGRRRACRCSGTGDWGRSPSSKPCRRVGRSAPQVATLGRSGSPLDRGRVSQRRWSLTGVKSGAPGRATATPAKGGHGHDGRTSGATQPPGTA
jgi:hypothetical protein